LWAKEKRVTRKERASTFDANNEEERSNERILSWGNSFMKVFSTEAVERCPV
jgi:hypothetical protein